MKYVLLFIGLLVALGAGVAGLAFMTTEAADPEGLREYVSVSYDVAYSEAIPTMLDMTEEDDYELSVKTCRTCYTDLEPAGSYLDGEYAVIVFDFRLRDAAEALRFSFKGEKIATVPAPERRGIGHLYTAKLYIGSAGNYAITIETERQVVWCGPKQGFCHRSTGDRVIPGIHVPRCPPNAPMLYKPADGELGCR